MALSSWHLDPEPARSMAARPPCDHGLRECEDPLGWPGYSMSRKQPWELPDTAGQRVSPKGPGDKKPGLLVLPVSSLPRAMQRTSACQKPPPALYQAPAEAPWPCRGAGCEEVRPWGSKQHLSEEQRGLGVPGGQVGWREWSREVGLRAGTQCQQLVLRAKGRWAMWG